MMTLREVCPPENISTTQAQAQAQAHVQAQSENVVVSQKVKAARRKRLEIQKLRYTAQENGVVPDDVAGPLGGGSCVSHGAVSVMGRRREMEDAVSVILDLVENHNASHGHITSPDSNNNKNNKYDFFGVYDGHGGSHVATACRDRMHAIVAEECRKGDTWQGGIDWEKVMMRCFERMDKEVGGGEREEEVEEMTVGSTAVMALVSKDEIVVANCGDSRAIICRNGVAMPLSFDHKPDRPDELARIEAAGGRVINWNGFRVLGVLATSRSIGDHYLRPYVSCTPEVTINKRTKEDEFLILASDGLWDVISNEVACQIVRRCLTGKIQRKTPGLTDGLSTSSRAEVAAALLTELAIAKGSKDNISVIVVELRKFSRFIC